MPILGKQVEIGNHLGRLAVYFGGQKVLSRLQRVFGEASTDPAIPKEHVAERGLSPDRAGTQYCFCIRPLAERSLAHVSEALVSSDVLKNAQCGHVNVRASCCVHCCYSLRFQMPVEFADELLRRKRLGNTSPCRPAGQCTRPVSAGFQTCGSSSSRRCSGVSGSRSSTSRRYLYGS